MEKVLKKVESIFMDTNEGVNVLYRAKGSEYGALLWTVSNDYGSVEGRIVLLFGCDEELRFSLNVFDWKGKGNFFVEDKLVAEFDNLEEGEKIVSKYVRDYMNEDYFVE